MKLKVRVLEVSSGTYEGNPYKGVMVRYNDKLVKFKVDTKSEVDLDSDSQDKDYILEVAVFKGKDNAAVVKVVGAELA